MSETSELSVGLAVRITGGKFNGFDAQIAKLCENHCSVLIEFEKQIHEVITETKWLTPLHLWAAKKTAVELQLRGHHNPAM